MGDVRVTVEALQQLRRPVSLSFRYDGSALAVAVDPASSDGAASLESRIWEITTGGDARLLTSGPGRDALPSFSPIDERLAFATDRREQGRMELHLLEPDGEAVPLGDIPGSVEELHWTADGSALVVLAADRGLDSSADTGAVRLWWGQNPDPMVFRAAVAKRRLFRVATQDGETTEVGPEHLAVWAFALVDPHRALALVSRDPSERGWYDAELALIDFESRSARIVFKPAWQLQCPAAAPDGRLAAVIEGWASDRGLVAGTIRIVDLRSGESRQLAPETLTDVCQVAWRDTQSLWFAGWRDLGTTYGVVQLDGHIAWSEQVKAALGPSRFSARITPTPQGCGLAAVSETVGCAPEVKYRINLSMPWRQLSAMNRELPVDPDVYPEIREVEWLGPDELPIRGLLLQPRRKVVRPSALVVNVHGGPTTSIKYAFDPGSSLPLVAAGFAVLLPNYRGSSGRGQDFAQRNVGDPGGAEFEDILRGVDWCIEQGVADPERIGITGVSYGGYLTAWAVATSDRFNAAVVICGISNLLSCNYTCNHAFCEFIVAGRGYRADDQRLLVERSPISNIAGAVTPTLILHGAEDRCTPPGQGQELYQALLTEGVDTELVVYPRDGHGFRERMHQIDAWQRTTAWMQKYLGVAD